MFIAVLWEILENTIIYDFSFMGDACIINIFGDIFIGDLLGFVIAYICVGKRFK